jgi:hypothetical protein
VKGGVSQPPDKSGGYSQASPADLLNTLKKPIAPQKKN